MPRTDVLAGRAMRLQRFAPLSERYISALEQLMSNPMPIVRSRALEQFKKSVGLEGSGGFHVNVNAAAVARADGPRNFEEMLDAVKRKMVEEKFPEEFLVATFHGN